MTDFLFLGDWPFKYISNIFACFHAPEMSEVEGPQVQSSKRKLNCIWKTNIK